MYQGDFGLLLRNFAFQSLFGVQVSRKFGDDSVSHIVMLNQKVARSWKFHVPPRPSCFGGFGGSFGRWT
jgi:hypothetical protein